MYHTIYFILKTNRVAFQRVWHVFTIVLVLVSNFGALAAATPALAKTSAMTNITDAVQVRQANETEINSSVSQQVGTSRLASPIVDHPDQLNQSTEQNALDVPGSKLTLGYFELYSPGPGWPYSWISYSNVNCRQVNPRTVLCSGSLTSHNNRHDIWQYQGVHFLVRTNYSNMGTQTTYYSFMTSSPSGPGFNSNSVDCRNCSGGATIKPTSAGKFTTSLDDSYRFADWSLNITTPDIDWSGSFSLAMSLDPLSQSIPPESTYCTDCSSYSSAQATVGNTGNTFTGGFSYPVGDLSVPTSAGPLSFNRTYISQATERYTDTLGPGWTHNQDIKLVFPTDPAGRPGYVLFKSPSGNLYRFLDNNDYAPYPGVQATLVKASDSYTLQETNQNKYVFDLAGKLQNSTNPQGQSFLYTYDSSGRLEQVRAAADSTRFLHFDYDLQGRLSDVKDQTERSVSFTYDETTGDLKTATDVLNNTWDYSYDSAHHLEEIKDPNNAVVLTNEYMTPNITSVEFTQQNMSDYG
jgi:YD repeat-containing protein